MFNRFEAYKKAIADKIIDFNTLQLMIDFHIAKGTLSQEEGQELFNLMDPPAEESGEETSE